MLGREFKRSRVTDGRLNDDLYGCDQGLVVFSRRMIREGRGFCDSDGRRNAAILLNNVTNKRYLFIFALLRQVLMWKIDV